MNICRARWVGLDLAAQVADVDPQNMHIIIAVAPHLPQQLMMGDDFACMRHKNFEQVIFGWRELDLFFTHHDQTAGEIHAQAFGFKNRFIRR
jgi:hypothetical protein